MLYAAFRNCDVGAMLGVDPDLLIWIPKVLGVATPPGMRPLRRPTSLIRLFGTLLVCLAGPTVEAQASDKQAAIRGWESVRNVATVYCHLAAAVGLTTDCGTPCSTPLLVRPVGLRRAPELARAVR